MQKIDHMTVRVISGAEFFACLLADAGLAVEEEDLYAVARTVIGSSHSTEIGGSAAATTTAPAGTCQWIAGDPHWNDACKCGVRALDGTAWCGSHLAKIYMDTEEAMGICDY